MRLILYANNVAYPYSVAMAITAMSVKFSVMFTASSGVVNWVHTICLKKFSRKPIF